MIRLDATEKQASIREIAREIAERVVAPRAAELDRTERFPRATLEQLAGLGLMTLNVPPPWGRDGGAVAFTLAIEEIARACAATAVMTSVTNMVAETIARFGTQAQQREHLPRFARGEHVLGSFALSEPDAASDPASLRTTARRNGGVWVIDGAKQWITGGAYAGVLVVWARTGAPDSGARGISCFLVGAGSPGLDVGRTEDKLGIRGSNTVALRFDRCRVPEDALLGPLHGGFPIAMAALDGGRIGIGAQACGIARAALDASLSFATQRTASGARVADDPTTQFTLADMRLQLDAARLLVHRAGARKERGERFTTEAAMAKLFASEAAVRICNDAVQIHGLRGYARDLSVERYLRDARVTTIYEGTSEIQRAVIARGIL